VLVVAAGTAGAPLLERVDDARRTGATVLALEAGDAELRHLAHEALTVPVPVPGEPCAVAGESGAVTGESGAVAFDVVQHLVTAAAGEEPPQGRRKLLDRMTRLAERLTAPPPVRW
jgi:hypothetical protein